jgi:hypothetical protein
MVCVEEILVALASVHLASGKGIGITYRGEWLPWGLVIVRAYDCGLIWTDDVLQVSHVAYLGQHAWAQ